MAPSHLSNQRGNFLQCLVNGSTADRIESPRKEMLMASARIIIPCYNEEKRLDVSSFSDFRSPSHNITFLFINDGSTDRTQRVLESLKTSDPQKFTVQNLRRNQGKAEAVRRGILAAIDSHPDYVGFWDADLATPLDAIPQFLDIAESRPELEMIIGSRVKLLGRKIERRRSRHYLGRVFATAVSIVLSLEVYDTQCGAKLFRASPSVSALFQEPFRSRWIFDVEIIARLIQARRGKNLPQADRLIYEFPLTEWRDIPGSKLRYSDFARAAWELSQIHKYYFGNRQQ
jgi:glycosyltransferase involved in cell wall biosynthesis